MNSSQIIENVFGGIRPAAKALGKPPSTVQNWITRDRIPPKIFPEFISAAASMGKTLTLEALYKSIKPKRKKS